MRLGLGSLRVGPSSNPDSDLVQPESFSAIVSRADLDLSSSGSFEDRQPFAGGCVSDPVVYSPSAELAVSKVAVQFSREFEYPVVSRFDFPPLPTAMVLSSMSLDTSHRSEGPSPAPVTVRTCWVRFSRYLSSISKQFWWCLLGPSAQT